jgi:hypothetical protein
MISQKLKSIGALTLTLIFGILLGLLVPSLYHKGKTYHSHNKEFGNKEDSVKDSAWLSKKLYHILEPDSLQKEKIKPIALWASLQLDSIEFEAHANAAIIIDSLKNQLHPVVTDAQWMKLQEFGQHRKGKHHGLSH